MEADAGIQVCGDVIKELMACFLEGLGAVGLACHNCAEQSKEGGVDCSSIVQQCADDVLYAFYFFCQKWGGIVLLHPLIFCAILDGHCFVGCVLRSRWLRVLVLVEHFCDIAGHVGVDVTVDIVPGEFDSAEK